MLHFEKLDVDQVSIQFVAAAVAISEQVPKGYAALADQLRRAAAPPELARAKHLIVRIVEMLTKMCR